MKTFLLFVFFFNVHIYANESNVICYYDEIAANYDNEYGTTLCEAENQVLTEIIEPFVRGNLLDLGCGTGGLLDCLDVENYIGIDISPKMIELAQLKHPSKQFIANNIENVISDLETGSFDTIISLFGPISYISNPEKLMSELYRILKPGGTLFLMPYTKRVQNKFLLGYSTGSEDTISKIYYDEQMLLKLVEKLDMSNVQIIGFNYFGNLIDEMSRLLNQKHPKEFYIDLLRKERQITKKLPLEYARHGILIANKKNG